VPQPICIQHTQLSPPHCIKTSWAATIPGVYHFGGWKWHAHNLIWLRVYISK
jgi:hypothetical protein